MTAYSNLRVLIPAELRRQVETRTAAENTSVQDVVVDLLTAYVKPKPKTRRKAT